MVGLKPLKSVIKKILPRTLFGRSLMIMITPALLLQMIVSFVFFDRHWTAMSSRLADALAGEINMIVSQIEQADSRAEINKIIETVSSGMGLLVTFEEGVKSDIGQQNQNDWRWYGAERLLEESLDQRLKRSYIIKTFSEEKIYEIKVQSEKGLVTFVAIERRLSSSTTYIFILWLLGSSFILFAIAIVFMRNQIRPIRKLAVAAERFGKGEDMLSFKPQGALEVRRAAVAFIDMRDRIRRQIEQRTTMLAGVSHDLRTPLTRMKLQLEMLGNTPDIDDLRKDIAEMERMVEGYLAFARGDGNEERERIDFRTVLERIVAQARRQGAEVQERYSDDLSVRVRPMAMERALANLVSNAAKYAEHIWVNAYVSSSGMIEITIDDDGPGITPEMRENVFKPFFRVDGSRNTQTGGVGLGLSIAQDVVHNHGGEIWLEDSNRGGLRVVVSLPV